MVDTEALVRLLNDRAGWNETQTLGYRHPVFGGIDLAGVDLSGVDLSNTHIPNACFSDARLNRVDFTHANVSGGHFESAQMYACKFEGTDFSGANFSKAKLAASRASWHVEFADTIFDDADLNRVVFHGASFVNASLVRVDLRNASFVGCDFTNAQLVAVKMGSTLFSDCNIATAKLDAITHEGPSALDLATLRKARGKLPVAFLKDCGLSDFELFTAQLYNPSLTAEQITSRMYDVIHARISGPIQISPVFLSYSSNDNRFVDTLARKLSDSGVRYWRDSHDLNAGPLEQQVDIAIRLHPVVIVILSKHSIDSDWVDWEVSLAREHERATQRNFICPIALDDSWRHATRSRVLGGQIKKYNILDFSRWSDDDQFNRQFAKLIRGLRLFYSRPESR